jgi:hypothetical protein
MKKYAFLLLLTCLALHGCISFAIRPPNLPENMLEQISLCRDVDDTRDQWRPKDISSAFLLKDGSLVCFVKIRYVEKEIQIRWKWYSPQNNLIKDTGNISVNAKGQYLDEVTAYDTFRFKPEEEMIGEWTVVFFIDDILAGKRTFTINEEDKSGP